MTAFGLGLPRLFINSASCPVVPKCERTKDSAVYDPKAARRLRRAHRASTGSCLPPFPPLAGRSKPEPYFDFLPDFLPEAPLPRAASRFFASLASISARLAFSCSSFSWRSACGTG